MWVLLPRYHVDAWTDRNGSENATNAVGEKAVLLQSHSIDFQLHSSRTDFNELRPIALNARHDAPDVSDSTSKKERLNDLISDMSELQ